jgi:hypothetical protein
MFALPHGTRVVITFRPAGDGEVRATPRIYDNGRELSPAPSSYIAALQA